MNEETPELSALLQASQDLLLEWFNSDAIEGTWYVMIEDAKFKELARALAAFRKAQSLSSSDGQNAE